jgi:hypothetical protein
MPYSGSGSFTRLYDWTTDEGNGVNITASRFDSEMDGFATGLSTVICKDGQTTCTAAIPFAVGLKVSDGLVATPSLAFTSDVDTGFYRIGSGNVGLALDGVARATWAKDGAATHTINTAATNTVTNVLTLASQSSGTPAAGIGAGLAFIAETAAGNDETGAVIEAVTTDVTAASEDFDLVFKTMTAGAAADEKLRITSTDLLRQTIGSTTYTIATPVVLVAETTATNVASVQIKDLPTGTKRVEIRLMDVTPLTDATDLYLRLSTDNAATFLTGASDYGWNVVDSGAGAVANTQDGADSEIHLATSLEATTPDCMGVVDVFFKGSGRTFARSVIHYIDSAAAYGDSYSVGYTENTCNAIELLMSAGNITLTYSAIAHVG